MTGKKIKINKKVLDNIKSGKCVSHLIKRNLKIPQRNICYITTAIHVFANSVWLLGKSLQHFENGRGYILLNKGDLEYDSHSFKKPNGTSFTTDEMFEFFEQMIKLIVSIMNRVEPLQEFVNISSRFPYEELIEICPKFSPECKNDFEDPLDFIHFMCLAMNPVKDDGPSLLDTCTAVVNSIYKCSKCDFFKEEEPLRCQSVNLLVMLQKEDSLLTTNLSRIIESNRSGIFVENLLFDPQIEHNCDGSGPARLLKRMMFVAPPVIGAVMFFIHRHAISDGFVNIIISPDDSLIVGDAFLRHTSTLFFAKSHYVVALTLDDDRVIVHDDLKEKSAVFESFSQFYNDFNEKANQFDFGFFPDESFMFAYDVIAYDPNDEEMLACKSVQNALKNEIIKESCTHKPKVDYDPSKVLGLRQLKEQANPLGKKGKKVIDGNEFETFCHRAYAKEMRILGMTSCDDVSADDENGNSSGDETLSDGYQSDDNRGLEEDLNPNSFDDVLNDGISDSLTLRQSATDSNDGKEKEQNETLDADKSDRIEPVNVPEFNRQRINTSIRGFDGPIIMNNTEYVNISKELLKKAGFYVKSNACAGIPKRRNTANHSIKDYSELDALVIYKEKPSTSDCLGLWEKSPKQGVIHYGHAYLQNQPSFYKTTYSMDIWNLPGVEDENMDLLVSNLNLSELRLGNGEGIKDVCYTQEEHNKFAQNLQIDPFVIDEYIVKEPFLLVTPWWKSVQFRTATEVKDFTKRGIVGFLRSSPIYKHQYCLNISNAYFKGIFPPNYEAALIKLAEIDDEKEGSIVWCILNCQKTQIGSESEAIQKSIVDAFLGYLHSPLQTKKARVPLKDPKAQAAFEKLRNRVPLFFFVQKVLVDSHPKRLLKCQVITKDTKKHNDFYMKPMDHYSGFVYPTKWFKDQGVRGQEVPNGWIVSGKEPWYLNELIPENRKLSSEALHFETCSLSNSQVALRKSSASSSDFVTQKHQKDLSVVYSLMNMCQLAYHNISIKILKEFLLDTTDEFEQIDLEAVLSRHIELQDDLSRPSNMELKELVSYLPYLPISSDKEHAEVNINTDVALELIRGGNYGVDTVNQLCTTYYVATTSKKKKMFKQTKKGQSKIRKRKAVQEQVNTGKKSCRAYRNK